MAYSLFWRSPALPFVQKQAPISVPAGAVISNAASLRFTGKGATNYGKIQQENLMRLLESHAGPTEPPFATVGQMWFDTAENVLKVCTATPPLSISPTADWRPLNATFVSDPSDPPPVNPEIGDRWFQRTGPSSGILYVYDNIGRYPLIDWDAHATNVWPAVATTTLGIRINQSTFSGPSGSNPNEAYIHGFTGVTPADVPGSATLDPSGTLPIPNGVLWTGMENPRGFIVYDAGGTMVSTQGPGTVFFSVRRVGYADNAWEYDNNAEWVPFTPNANMYVIGYLQVNAHDTNLPPGIVSAEVWTQAKTLQHSVYQARAALTKTEGGIGGWSQVWPPVEIAAGRDEFEEMFDSLMMLIGSPYHFGGSGAVERSVNYLTDMATLDLSRLSRLFYETSYDPLVSDNTSAVPARVQPDGPDWDRMLAAIRYAVSRLELPPGSAADISSVPFVQDGRPLPEPLLSLSSTDVRYSGLKRRYNQRYGSVTMNRLYTQTANLLEAAIQNRYLMKGILGTSGTNTTFSPTVVLTSQQRFQIGGPSLTGTMTHGLDFDFGPVSFAYSKNMREFFYSAQALDIVMVHTPGGAPTAQDLNVVALLSSQGRLRLTADQLFVMTPIATPGLSASPIAGGFNAIGTSSTTLHTITGGGASITLRGQRVSGTAFLRMFLDITSGGALTGTFEVRWAYVDDQEMYNTPAPTRVYPAPIPFILAHQQGSGAFAPIGT